VLQELIDIEEPEESAFSSGSFHSIAAIHMNQ
jgi:hypothetical protein